MTTPDEHPIRSAFVLYRHRRQRQIEILAGHRYDIAIVATCTNGAMLAVWSDDNATGGSALREAPLPCEPIAPLPVTSVSAVTSVVSPVAPGVHVERILGLVNGVGTNGRKDRLDPRQELRAVLGGYADELLAAPTQEQVPGRDRKGASAPAAQKDGPCHRCADENCEGAE